MQRHDEIPMPVSVHATLASPPSTRSFTATCIECGERFEYATEAVKVGERWLQKGGPRNVCPKEACQKADHDRRWQAAEDERARAEAELLERRREAYRTWVPARYHGRALSSHVPAQLAEWAPDQSAYIYGPPGSGKSHAAAALMHRVAGRESLEWYSTRRLIADAQAAIGSKKIDRPDIFAHPLRPKVLVLNDLFAERSTEYAVAEVGNLVDARYDAGLPIVATGNLTLSEAAAKVDGLGKQAASIALELERIVGRVLEMTSAPNGIRCRMDATDWRVDIAAAAGGDR